MFNSCYSVGNIISLSSCCIGIGNIAYKISKYIIFIMLFLISIEDMFTLKIDLLKCSIIFLIGLFFGGNLVSMLIFSLIFITLFVCANGGFGFGDVLLNISIAPLININEIPTFLFVSSIFHISLIKIMAIEYAPCSPGVSIAYCWLCLDRCCYV